MKTFLSLFAALAFSISFLPAKAQQDKSKRASPPVTVSETINGGATLTINYSQPSVKGRTIGKDLEPMPGKVWRAGANEATTFEASQDVRIDGKALPAGKYALFMIDNGSEWTVIFNKKWNTWGAYDYGKNKDEDALQLNVKAGKAPSFAEKLTYTIDKNGRVSLLWGDKQVAFTVK